MKETVLILTNSYEHGVKLVCYYLEQMQHPFVRVNADKLFKKNIGLRYTGHTMSGFITSGRRIELDRVKSVWYRRPSMPRITDRTVGEEYHSFLLAEYRSFLWSLSTSVEAFWMNPPPAVQLLEHNKFRQIIDASRIGLRVPETVITNNATEVINFCRERGGKVALKVLRPSAVSVDDADKFVYTNVVSQRQIRDSREEIRLAPVFIQEYIEKKLEFRVTIVGERIFACAIHSQDSERTKHDWRRYDLENVKHEPYDLPQEVEQKLLALMGIWGLVYGAIDMILTPDGEFVFLEVNPTGQWGWIEALTGMPISRAIAELLANPPSQ